MRYRHRYHAGNFADVHKHITLVGLLQALERKPRGFLYLDSHAGAGRYAPPPASAPGAAESRRGIEALIGSAPPSPGSWHPIIGQYLDQVARWRERWAAPCDYPGSPCLAFDLLRPQDRAVCCEILTDECRALGRTLGSKRTQIRCADGYQQLRACLPPPERRALILIDPPYERPQIELDQALETVSVALRRLPGAVLALWYPIKHERALQAWRAAVRQRLAGARQRSPVLTAELWLYPCDSSVGLNGSGMLLVNPPYGFDAAAQQWLGQLHAALDPAGRGGWRQQWLLRERPATPVSPDRAAAGRPASAGTH